MAETKKCAHDACSCSVDEDTKYCSEHCHDAADRDIVEIRCDCAHPGCA